MSLGEGRIQVSCPNCSKPLAVPDTAVGKAARCPACETKFRITAPRGIPVDSGLTPISSPLLNANQNPLGGPLASTGADGLLQPLGSNIGLGHVPAQGLPPVVANPARPNASVVSPWGTPPKPAVHAGGIAWSKVGIGTAMMVGAVVWFVVGLAGNRVFFYPPILFILGIVGVVKGLLGKRD